MGGALSGLRQAVVAHCVTDRQCGPVGAWAVISWSFGSPLSVEFVLNVLEEELAGVFVSPVGKLGLIWSGFRLPSWLTQTVSNIDIALLSINCVELHASRM